MMDITSNEIRRRKAVSEALMKGTCSEGATTFTSASAGNVHSPGFSSAVSVGEKRKRTEHGESCNTENGGVEQDNRRGSNDNGCAKRGEESIQPKISECAGLKFNDFKKLREDVNFAVGQTWALYDKVDGMPRLYARIRKVSAPSFEFRITYLEPDPDDEKEIQWFEQDLPVSVGQFRLGKSQNTKDRSMFSHVVHCKEGSNTGHLNVSPRKGETWALFKNWDIKWSSELDSHRKYEYEFVEILSDYADGTGVSVAFLHKAKGFASVFFRTGTGDADVSQILPHSLYRFSHMIPSFKMTGVEGKGLPKEAYELDQAALPETIEETMVPTNAESNRKPKRHAIYFASKGKVFQTGQIWSYCSGLDEVPLYYGRIQKITAVQVLEQETKYKLHVSRFMATRFPVDVIQWEEKKMPVGCGTFYARNALEIITPDDISQQIMPQTSMDGNEFTILPKVGEVWVIHRFWNQYMEYERLAYSSCDIVEILDDTLDYKVLLLERSHGCDKGEDEDDHMFFQAVTEYKYNEIDGSEPIFTIPKSERLRFSYKAPVSRVTKEIHGVLNDLTKVDSGALPHNLVFSDH